MSRCCTGGRLSQDIHVQGCGVCQDVYVQEGGEFRSSLFHVQTTQGGGGGENG